VRALPGVGGGPVYAATRFDVLKAGDVTLDFGKDRPAMMWVDGKSVDRGNLRVDLTAGTHTVVVRLDPASMPKGLTLRCADVVFRSD
jgi:hypothetical protein